MSRLRIEDTIKCKPTIHGFGSGSGMASVVDPSLQYSDWEKSTVDPPRVRLAFINFCFCGCGRKAGQATLHIRNELSSSPVVNELFVAALRAGYIRRSPLSEPGPAGTRLFALRLGA